MRCAMGKMCCMQDLPEFFEDNMATWMTHFQTLLSTNNPLLVTEVTIMLLLLSFFSVFLQTNLIKYL